MIRRFFKCLTAALLALVTSLMLLSCVSSTILQTKIPTYPPHPLIPLPEKVVIANAFDVKAEDFRDKKTETFVLLIDNAMMHAAQQIKERSRADAEVVKGNVVSILNRDSVDAFIRSVGATHGMFIASFDAHFLQTRVEVTKTDQGKDREAFYDLVVKVKYVLKSLEGLSFDTLVSVSRFHSSRAVLSGLLAAGPSIVSNQDDAQELTVVNVDQYLKSFFLGEEFRERRLPFPKAFNTIEQAVRQYNYTVAFEETRKLTVSPDKKIAANAYYICAVLAEREGDFQAAKAYLQESLARQNAIDAQTMLADYRHMPTVR